jgi:hypothetical protein
MARVGQLKPVSDRRLSDLVSVGLLTRVFPPELVDEVIADAGRTEQRHRSLPAQTMAYFAIGLALHSDGSYDEVMALMTEGLAWAESEGAAEAPVLPSKSAIFQARVRLGVEPVRALFERVARPLATESTPGAWLAGRRLVSIDGTTFDVADSDVNNAFFGRPGVMKGERSAFPQARMVALAECSTHAIFDAELGPYTSSEPALAEDLLGRLQPGMLLLADRGFTSYALWRKAISTGADLLWRAKTGLRPEHLQTLDDDSWLAQIRLSTDKSAEPITVRVIDYTVEDGRDNPESYRLFTTITDPTVASATELAAAYVQRWEIELAFDELKTHQRGPRTVLRSKSPDLVRQEIWGHLCCHYAIRSLMAEGDKPVAGADLSSLKLLGTVGEPINPEAWRWFHQKFGKGQCPIVDTWWQTETGGILISPLPGATDLKPGSATRPFFGVKPALMDADGNELEGVNSGGLVLKDSWPGQMRTILHNHDRFVETYFSTYEGTYFTGDGARRDEDGYYWITGRVDDVLNVSGHRMGTAEVESALVAHDAVAEAAVVGCPHEIKGQGIYVYVTLNQDRSPSDELAKELKQWVRKEIGPIATPDVIQWADGLPKTRSGKIMRRILRKIASDETDQLGDTSTLADPNVVDDLIEGHRVAADKDG